MPVLDLTPVLTGETFPWLIDTVSVGSRGAPVGRSTAALEPSVLHSLSSLRPLNSLSSLLSQKWAGYGWPLTAQGRPAPFFSFWLFVADRCGTPFEDCTTKRHGLRLG